MIGLFLIFFIIIKLVKLSKSSSIFKTINLINGNYLLINRKGIYTYDNNSLLLIKSYNFENELIDLEIKSISYFEINDSIFILIKNNLYIFNNKGEFKSIYNLFENSEINYYSINLYKYSDFSECLYFIEYIDLNNNLIINLYKYDFSLNDNIIINSKEFNIEKNNKINCNIMINSNNENYMTCFFIGEKNNEIIAYNFYIEDDNTYNNINIKKYSNNNYIKTINSEISSEQIKSLICFINYLDIINCIIYDINTFTFIEYINPLNCHTINFDDSYYLFNIEKYIDSNNYFLYYFFSSNEFSLIIFNENFEIISDIIDYKINKSIINKNIPYFSIISSSNEINVLYEDGNYSYFINKPENEYVDMIKMETNIEKESIEKKMNKILKNIEMGNSYEIISDEYKIRIDLLKRQNNDTYIEFLSCEDKLSNL